MKKTVQTSRPNAGSFCAGMALFLWLCFPGSVLAQDQIYDDFEGKRMLYYGERSGVLDTNAKNPAPNVVNKSERCGMYVRNAARKFANIKMSLHRNLTGVESYATYEGMPPRMKMKVYTSAPPGTLVEVLLGNRKGNNDYPAGTHSQYQAYTSVSNEWEELEFKFAQIPQGSETSASQIDQAVLLFNPNSSTSDTYYFDDLTGPSLGADKSGIQNEGVKPGKPAGNNGAKDKPGKKAKTKTLSGKAADKEAKG
jgi:hypothetical protein